MCRWFLGDVSLALRDAFELAPFVVAVLTLWSGASRCRGHDGDRFSAQGEDLVAWVRGWPVHGVPMVCRFDPSLV